MLNPDIIRNNPEKVKQGIKSKNADPVLIDKFLELDKKRRGLITEIDNLRSRRNKEEEIYQKTKDESVREFLNQSKVELKKLEDESKTTEEEFKKISFSIPNIPEEETPIGKDESENKVLREVGKKGAFNFTPRDYLGLAQELDVIDVERASKTSGSRFGFLKGKAAQLEIALIHYAFDKLSKKGFVPVIPPVLIKPEPFKAMGYLEQGGPAHRSFSGGGEEEVYHLEKDDLYLIGTSEQIIGPMHDGEVFEEKELPKRYVGFSSCFRREAGSYGKDTKGILRVHQFDKVEMFSFTKKEDSKKEHQFLLSIEEEIMKDLAIPYRVINICTGDLGFPAARKFDIEAWMPGQAGGDGEYRETHSTSNTTDFQARRLNIRYERQKSKVKSQKLEFVHMLNGTAIAIGRMLIAIIENYQNKDGSVSVPKALWEYTGFKKI